MMAREDQNALKTLTDNGMTANQVSAESQQKFIDISKSCYDKFKELIKDNKLFDATAAFTGRN